MSSVCIMCIYNYIMLSVNISCFQNKKTPPKRKRLGKMDSWREPPTGDTQVAQLYFYLLCVLLQSCKESAQPQPLLGMFIEGEIVRCIIQETAVMKLN